MTSVLTNEQIRLRALEPEDLSLLYTIENDTRLWCVSNHNVPYSRYALRHFIANNHHDIYKDGHLRLVIEVVATQKAVGLIDLTDFSPIDRRADLGIAILNSERRNGYAEHSLAIIEQYAQEVLSLNQLSASVMADNAASRALFEKRGFRCTAELPSWYFADGTYKSRLIFQKFLEKTTRTICQNKKTC